MLRDVTLSDMVLVMVSELMVVSGIIVVGSVNLCITVSVWLVSVVS